MSGLAFPIEAAAARDWSSVERGGTDAHSAKRRNVVAKNAEVTMGTRKLLLTAGNVSDRVASKVEV